MLTRRFGTLSHREDGPAEAGQLEREGWAVLHGVFGDGEVAKLRRQIERIFDRESPSVRVRGRSVEDYAHRRHATFNKSAAAQRAIAHPRILEVIEPLLGEDCHVIANTSWRDPAHEPGQEHGGRWHIDAGPHVVQPEGTEWPDDIPYPVFAIGAHILLRDCPRECGPTAVLPGSHRSGRVPPGDRTPLSLTYDGRLPVALTGRAGDVALFVSDAWHRRLPPIPSGDTGRFFLQCHYGRRDIAQRVELTADVNHLSKKARKRAETRRDRALIGLHGPGFYDA
ncbi:MAG: phytanoyl-CoA dioxygenase family protein [Actinomycetota bacterium]